jgi:hypothetical protein
MPGSSLGQQRQLVTVFERRAVKGGEQDLPAKFLALPAVVKAPLIRKGIVKNRRIFLATKPIGSNRKNVHPSSTHQTDVTRIIDQDRSSRDETYNSAISGARHQRFQSSLRGISVPAANGRSFYCTVYGAAGVTTCLSSRNRFPSLSL